MSKKERERERVLRGTFGPKEVKKKKEDREHKRKGRLKGTHYHSCPYRCF